MNAVILLFALFSTSSASAASSLPPNTAVCLTEAALEDLRAQQDREEPEQWLCGVTDAQWTGRAVVLEPGPRNSRIRLFTADGSTVAWVATTALIQ